MNKQSVVSILFFLLVTIVSLVLILSVQIPILLAGGSDSLEVIVKLSNLSQWFTLALFLMSYLFCFTHPKLKNKLHTGLKISLIAITLIMFLMSGHNFRYSGKKHMLIDSYFFIPIQSVAIDPTEAIENARIEKTKFRINAYSGDTKLLSVWCGIPPLSLNANKVSELIQNFGFE